MTLKWDYVAGIFDISMSGYVKDVLQKFHQPTPTIPQHFRHQCIAPSYGSTARQLDHPTYESPYLKPAEDNNIHQIVGKLCMMNSQWPNER